MDGFEWDEAKRADNLRKHGVDFPRAARLFAGRFDEWRDPRPRPDGEARWLAVGTVEGLDLLVVFTWRGRTRRIISAWRIGHASKARYQALLDGPDSPHDGPDVA